MVDDHADADDVGDIEDSELSEYIADLHRSPDGPRITGDHIRTLAELHDAVVSGAAIGLTTTDEVIVAPQVTLDEDDRVTRIVLTGGELADYCGGELDDLLAEQLAEDLTAGLAESED